MPLGTHEPVGSRDARRDACRHGSALAARGRTQLAPSSACADEIEARRELRARSSKRGRAGSSSGGASALGGAGGAANYVRRDRGDRRTRVSTGGSSTSSRSSHYSDVARVRRALDWMTLPQRRRQTPSPTAQAVLSGRVPRHGARLRPAPACGMDGRARPDHRERQPRIEGGQRRRVTVRAAAERSSRHRRLCAACAVPAPPLRGPDVLCPRSEPTVPHEPLRDPERLPDSPHLL